MQNFPRPLPDAAGAAAPHQDKWCPNALFQFSILNFFVRSPRISSAAKPIAIVPYVIDLPRVNPLGRYRRRT